jgi:Ser/Thr protein kinase RdoA (MazF antagonist)
VIDSLKSVFVSCWDLAFTGFQPISSWRNMTWVGHLEPRSRLPHRPPYSPDKVLVRFIRHYERDLTSRIASECRVLADIDANLDLRCPIPLLCRDGAFSQRLRIGEEEWFASLFRWIDGSPAAHRLPADYFARVGRLTGRLHRFLHARYGTQDLDRRVFSVEHLLRDVRMLEGRGSAAGVPKRYVECLRRFLDAQGPAIADALERSGCRLVHGDITQKNLIVAGDALCLIDFEACQFAPPALEAAATLRDWRHREEWSVTRDEWRRGYAEFGDPDPLLAVLDHFIAVRYVGLMLYFGLMVRREHDDPGVAAGQLRILERGRELLERFPGASAQ